LPAGTPLRKFQAYNSQLMEIFVSLRSLSCVLTGPFSRRNIAIDEIYFLERCVVVLLAETNPTVHPVSNLSSDEQNPLLEYRRTTYQILLAAQMYIYLFLRDTLVPSPIFSVLVSRLSFSLYSSEGESRLREAWQKMDSNDNRENDNENEILFWALVLGALAAEGREERRRFGTHLRRLCNLFRIRTFTEFVEKLQKTAWIEKKVDDKLLELWSEVQGL